MLAPAITDTLPFVIRIAEIGVLSLDLMCAAWVAMRLGKPLRDARGQA
jgi:hypothetical protein